MTTVQMSWECFQLLCVVAESLSMPLNPEKNDNASPIVEWLWKFLQLSLYKFPCAFHIAGNNIVCNEQGMLMVGLKVAKSTNFIQNIPKLNQFICSYGHHMLLIVTITE